MRGRKPTPDAIKALKGNPGKRRMASPVQAVGCERPTCPRHLDKTARAEWRRMAKSLSSLGLLAATDRAALAAYCLAYSRWVAAEKEIANGRLVLTTSNGNSVQNPFLAIANKSMEQMVKLLSEFGMTPTSRSRIHVAPAADVDPFEAMFNAAKNAKNKTG